LFCYLFRTRRVAFDKGLLIPFCFATYFKRLELLCFATYFKRLASNFKVLRNQIEAQSTLFLHPSVRHSQSCSKARRRKAKRNPNNRDNNRTNGPPQQLFPKTNTQTTPPGTNKQTWAQRTITPRNGYPERLNKSRTNLCKVREGRWRDFTLLKMLDDAISSLWLIKEVCGLAY
jgi:hypothetical protein